ncbi:MAG: 50S ribosomal protein L11 [Candidatus Roizmanbacteria bacterium]|nr:50S ribosomal protein L11 [Candidatus Roizmanbacteria bacterium]
MAKKIKAMVKLNLPGGAATPAPPVGPALGQHGVPLMEFVKQYNERTADKKGQVIPAVITIYEDRTFDFITKLPPVAELIKKKLNIKKGAGNVGSEVAGTLTKAQAEEIAKEKMQDLNAKDLEAATKIVMGSARSMGVEVK